MSRDVDDLERLLRIHRATPRPAFVRELERSLAERRVARDRRRIRVAIAGSGLVAALAAVAFALSVTGLLPLAPGGAHRADARKDCRTTRVDSIARRPQFVRDRDGELHLRYPIESVSRLARLCR